MRFYRMQAPEYETVKDDLAVNGTLEYIYRFPSVSCNACNATHGGSRILACPAPEQIHDDRRFRSRWPLEDQEHAAMQREVAGYLNTDNFSEFETFKPGDNFQPAYYDSQTPPAVDFLWPNIRSFVVSAKMKQMIFDELAGNVEIIPVTPRKIGKRDPFADPDKAFQDAADAPALAEPYYQILVRAESDYPNGGGPVSICPVCKHETFDEEKRDLSMRAEMWRGQPIFLLKTTLFVIVTEALAEKIEKIGATNVAFAPI